MKQIPRLLEWSVTRGGPFLNRVVPGQLIRELKGEDMPPLGRAVKEQARQKKKQVQGPWAGLGCRFWGQWDERRPVWKEGS